MVSPPSAPSSARALSVASVERVPLIAIFRDRVESDQLAISPLLNRWPSPMLQPHSLISPSSDLLDTNTLSDEIPSFTVSQ